ncbi:MAG: hypothetical protein ACI92G_000222 [Candidatus Pelagisphaera sp.]|jgi:hypothetical protein
MQDTRKGLNLWSIFPLLEEESPGDFSLACEDLNDALVLADVLRRVINKEIWNLQWEMASTAKHMKDLGVQLIVHGADIVFYKKAYEELLEAYRDSE